MVDRLSESLEGRAPPPRWRLKSVVTNASLLIASFALAGLLGEIGVRIAAPQQLIMIRPDFWAPLDTVGWGHLPNVNITMNSGERTVSVYTDAEGFRVGAAEIAPEGQRVLILGDSFMEAIQVDYEESAAGLLQSILPTLTGAPVVVRNAGVGGWDPDQYLLRARSLLAKSHFDLVITALYIGNDILSTPRAYLPPREPADRKRFSLPGYGGTSFTDAVLRPLNDLLEERSHLYLFFRTRLQTVRMMMGLAPVDFPPYFLKSVDNNDRFAVTADLATQIEAVASSDGADALFVFVPAPYQVDTDDLMRYVTGFGLDLSDIDLELPNRRLGEALEARGLHVVDLLTAFRAAHESGQRLYGAVDQHFSPEGHQLFVDLVAPVAAEMLDAR